MGVNLSKLWETVKDREAWRAEVHGVTRSRAWLSERTTLMHGEYGVEDVCLSTLALVGPDGCRGKVLVELTDEELAKMQTSAEALKSVISQIEI